MFETNPVIQSLMARKSMRVYEERPIPPEVKDSVIAAAMRAPTAGNMMLYSILDITSQSIKDTLARTCDNQPFIASAPMILIFLADYRRWVRTYRDINGGACRPLGPGDLLLASADAIIAAQNAVVAADALGLGSCYIGDIIENFELHRELLRLPENTAPVAMLCFGYPTVQQKARRQTARLDRELVVYENVYRELNREELSRMATPEQAKRLYDFKFVSDFAQEMNRSSAEILKNFCK